MPDMFSTRLVTIKDDLPRIAGKLAASCLPQLVRATALHAEAEAILNNNAHGLVDSGDMVTGWSTRFPGPLTAIVFNPMHYSVYWEFGHHNIFTRQYEAARPMLRPAAQKAYEYALEKGHELEGCLQ